ncbi:MAG TPA: histidinol-phosphate transaminase [Candidatus Hydrogenedens sp.]|nr:histidinol-phosphate transaminase [Candidatus Hydrogenedens sp.]HOL20474.1 histidinol-phosphate transaminase [Candidatus Hydrogenedens sp.]HPP57896.1 histidinol-phosphate transaminase [Candidatus Hydrogenedens sp.]
MSKYCINRLNAIEGYVPGEQPKEENVVKLNTNENPFPPSEEVLRTLSTILPEQLRRYPDPTAFELRRKIAQVYHLPGPEWVIVGNGMDEILAITMKTFVDYGQTIYATYPTYSLYEILAQLYGYNFQYHELDDNFCLTPPFAWESAKLVLITHPNAPSGVPTQTEIMKKICENDKQVIFIDEAYVDFCDYNYISWVTEYPNLIVGRTFSKSFSLAGIRLGFAVANPELISDMFKIKDSYNVNVITQLLGISALEHSQYAMTNIEIIKKNRTYLRIELQKLGFRVPDSQSNFLLAIWNREPTAEEIYNRLKEQRIYIRYFPYRRLENALRITIGTQKQSEILLEAIKKIVQI